MKRFPVTIVDNFYENPDLVRNWALSLKYNEDFEGRTPGKRTENLHNHPKFFNNFCEKLFSIFYDFNYTRLEWGVSTCFQSITKYSENPKSKLNDGWIHYDSDVFSGVIYLNPEGHLYSGTSVYEKMYKDSKETNQKEKYQLYSGIEVNEEKYEKSITANNGQFIETIRVENRYNRLVLFEGNVPHGVPSFYSSSDEPRLTQPFFVLNMKSSSSFEPLVRVKTIY